MLRFHIALAAYMSVTAGGLFGGSGSAFITSGQEDAEKDEYGTENGNGNAERTPLSPARDPFPFPFFVPYSSFSAVLPHKSGECSGERSALPPGREGAYRVGRAEPRRGGDETPQERRSRGRTGSPRFDTLVIPN
jgi:hypothetical protein